jgi:hypothetical protein
MNTKALPVSLVLFTLGSLLVGQTSAPATTPASIAVTLSGGHETDPRDRGRPVMLIGNALGVTPEVFREAFSRVQPAAGGAEPDPQQVQANKRVLLEALSKYGVTNERLDEVSNYYRYPPPPPPPGQGRGNRGGPPGPGDASIWKHKDAVVTATVVNGKVTGFTIKDAGAGYTTPPKVSVAGFADLKVKVTLHFDKDLAKNGSIESIKIEDAATAPK